MGKEIKIRRYGYDRRHKRHKNLVKTLVAVLVIGAAAAVGWFAFDPIYNFVTNLHLPTPQSQSEPLPPESQGPASLPQVSSGSTPEAAEGQGEEFPASVAYLPPYFFTGNNLESQLASLKAQGFTGVVLDLKDADGKVWYQSSLEQVAKSLAQEKDAFDLVTVAGAIRKAGLVPIGRIFAFQDHTAPAHLYEAAVKYMDSKVNWIDDSRANGGRPWLNPANAEAQQYILDLVEEVSGAGVDQIILAGMQFPEGYSLHLATYGVTGELDQSAVLAEFAVKARGVGEENGAAVWPTVNLLSASGISQVRYGSDVGRILEAAGRGIIEVMPEQFGGGVTSETLTLTAPAREPYETVKAALEASSAALGEAGSREYVAMVQAYTSATLAASVNQTYGKAQVEEQLKAAQEAGIEKAFWYNPGGIYPQS